MKKNALFILGFVLLSSLACCLSAQHVKIGLKAGASIPNLHDYGGDEISKGFKSKVAENYGIVADIGFSEKFSVKTGLDYAGQGAIRNGLQRVTDVPKSYEQLFAQLLQLLPQGTRIYADFNNEATLNYLEIPVMGKIEWGKKLKYYVNAGPYFGFLLTAKQQSSGNSLLFSDRNGTPLTVQGHSLPSISFEATTDVKDKTKPTNFGLTGGFGLAFVISNKSTVVLDARASYGLKTLQEDTSRNGQNRTGGIFLTFGYLFSFL